MKVYEAVARALAENGVTTLFGVMGDANMFMVNSFVRDRGGTFVAAAHESGAATMALGHALMSGGPGVCSVTHGPAMTNTITALVEGVKGSIPMLLLCGATPAGDREHVQKAAQQEFAVAAGAGFEQVGAPATATRDVARALRRAIEERTAVVLNLPADFDGLEIEYEAAPVCIPQRRSAVIQSEDLDDAIGIIAAAKRPLILAGRGASAPDARVALLKLANRIEAPVATTLKAKDLFRGEPNNLGIFGTVSTATAVDVIIESDCVVAFGASLNRYTTSDGTFLKGKRHVQVNREPSAIGKHALPGAGVVGDTAEVAGIMLHWLDEAEIPPSGFCSAELKQRIAPKTAEPAADGDGTVDFQRALLKLEALLPADRVLVTDAGRFVRGTWTYISAPGPDAFIPTLNFGSVGLGLSYGIGASLAARGRPIVVIAGDGGFVLGGLAEFNTAVRQGSDLIAVIFNDGGYGAEHRKFVAQQIDPGLSMFDWPDFAPVAEALGGDGVTVRSDADWARVQQAIHDRTRPLLIDIKLDPERMSLSS